MAYDDFTIEFRSLTVAEINDNASYIYKSAKDNECKGVFFKIRIVQSGFYSFHIDKTHERSFEASRQYQYSYPLSSLEIGRLNGAHYQKLGWNSTRKRTQYEGVQLQPGEYIAKAKIDFDRNFEKDFDVNLAVYAEYACDIEFASQQEAIALTGDNNVSWTPPTKENSSSWNDLGNTVYRRGISGWGSGEIMEEEQQGIIRGQVESIG